MLSDAVVGVKGILEHHIGKPACYKSNSHVNHREIQSVVQQLQSFLPILLFFHY